MRIEENPIRFGVFEVRREARELRKHGVRIKLEEQPFSVLLALLENPGGVVTRSDLRARLWPEGTFVDFDKSLTKAVNKIRTALNDSAAAPRYIETLSRRGYRFIAPVTGDGAEPPVAAMPDLPARSSRPGWLLGLGAAAIVLALGGGATWRRLGIGHASGSGVAPIRALAVLPIVNLTGDPAEYFADGLTDDLISDLSRIGTLRVISYTSSMRYKGARLALREVAAQLGVDGVIEGSVQRAGGRVRMNVKLIRAASDRQVWSDSYEGDQAEAAQLEGRVARAVAHQISAHLTAETSARLTRGEPANERAYEAYLHGRYLWNLRGRDSVIQAGGFFEQAVREDPHFALAWSGLADRYTIGWNSGANPDLAEKYARRAVALDGSLAEAHISLGFALHCQYRFAEAQTELKRGIELNPNYVTGHQLYAVHLLTVNRPIEALAENDRSLQLDPFSLPANNLRGIILTGLRQYDRARQSLRTASALDPQNPSPHYELARIDWIQQRALEALAEERAGAGVEPSLNSELLLRGQAEVERALALFGFREACRRSVQLKESATRADVAGEIPLQYGLLQDAKKVLDFLNRDVAGKGYVAVYNLETAPEYDFLRSDPRFQELLHRVGLP